MGLTADAGEPLLCEARHMARRVDADGRGRLFDRLERELAAAGIPAGPGDERPVTEADIAGLPATVQRYLRFMGVVGRPREWSFRGRFAGRLRLRPGTRWMPAEAWQYNSEISVARVFVLRVRLAGVLPMTGKDTYFDGHGRMLGKLVGLIAVADGKGQEFDIGELTTYLNDALWFAPSFLLRPEVRWAELDDNAFDVTLRDAGRSVSGRVFIDERGAPVDFATTDRFVVLPGGLRRAEWRTRSQNGSTPTAGSCLGGSSACGACSRGSSPKSRAG